MSHRDLHPYILMGLGCRDFRSRASRLEQLNIIVLMTISDMFGLVDEELIAMTVR